MSLINRRLPHGINYSPHRPLWNLVLKLSVSKSSRSDSNNGASKAVPWAHLVLLLTMFAPWQTALGACHVVTPSGSGSQTGADWSNAFAGLPATLTRGDIYYLADGNYGSYEFSTAASGTATIEIRKAQTYDHCTDAGWNAGTMGSAQAVFTNHFLIAGSYFILNGNGKQKAPGCGGAPGSTVSGAPPTPADCGILIKDTTGSNNGIINANSNSPSHYTLEYTEWFGDSTPSANEDMFFFGALDAGYSTFNHIYGHNAGCVYIQDGAGNRTISYSYFWGTEVQGVNSDGCHGQAEFETGGTSNVTIDNNVYRDITGTAIWTIASGGGTSNNWQIYNNVIWDSSPTSSWSPYTSDGILACINSGTNCTNFTMMQNDIINLTASSASGINNENTGSYTVENNIWYNNAGSTNFNVGTGGTYTHQYNSYLQAVGGPSGAGAALVIFSIPNPFVSWTTGNFSLASDNPGWNNRLALGPPYTTDVNGVPFSTDRGAYQLGQSSVQPPTNLQAAPH